MTFSGAKLYKSSENVSIDNIHFFPWNIYCKILH